MSAELLRDGKLRGARSSCEMEKRSKGLQPGAAPPVAILAQGHVKELQPRSKTLS